MQKKLYRVKVVLYVMAENESEARVAATNAQFDIFECTARKAERIEPAWVNAIPYNAEDDRTCAEIFASQQQQIRNLPMPFLIDTSPPLRIPASSAISYFNS